MPTAIISAPETYRNATRPAILDSVRAILNFYNVNEKDLLVYLNGDASGARPMHTGTQSEVRSGQFTDFISRKKLFVVAEVTDSEFNTGYGNLGRQLNNPPLWVADECRTYFIPIFEGSRINVDCNAHFKTRQEAETFRNYIQRGSDLQLANPGFSAHIHYPVPYEIMALTAHLKEVYEKSKPGEEIGYPDWFLERCKAPTSILTNAANENPIFGIKRRIDQIELILEEPRIQRTRKDGDVLGHYEVSFRYYFYWNNLIQWQIHYPMQINQIPLSSSYLPGPKDLVWDSYNPNRTFESQANDSLRGFNSTRLNLFSRYPFNDDWFPPKNFERVTPKFMCMIVVKDIDGPQKLGNIKEIPGLQWNKTVLKFILKYHDLVTTRSKTPIWLQLYSDDIPVLQEHVRLDRNGDLWLLVRPVIENTYRMVFNLDGMLGFLSPESKDLILTDSFYLNEFIPTIFPWWNWGENKQPPPGMWDDNDRPLTGWVDLEKELPHNDDNPVGSRNDLELIIEQIDALPEFPGTPSFMLNQNLIVR